MNFSRVCLVSSKLALNRTLYGCCSRICLSAVTRSFHSRDAVADSLLTFETAEQACDVFQRFRDQMSEQQILFGFQRAYSLTLAGIRKSPHVLSAGVLSKDLLQGATALAHPNISTDALCMIIEGLSRLEIISEVLFVRKIPDLSFDTLVAILKHCAGRRVRSAALVETVTILLTSPWADKHVSELKLYEIVPLIAKVAPNDGSLRPPMACRLVGYIHRKFYCCASNLAKLPTLAAFAASLNQGHLSFRLIQEHEELLQSNPNVLGEVVEHLPYVPGQVMDFLAQHVEQDPSKFTADALLNVLIGVGVRLSPEIQSKCIQLLLSKCSELSRQSLLRLLTRLAKIDAKDEHLLTCLSYLSMHVADCSTAELCHMMDLALVHTLDMDQFALLVLEETIERRGNEDQDQSELARLIDRLRRWGRVSETGQTNLLNILDHGD